MRIFHRPILRLLRTRLCKISFAAGKPENERPRYFHINVAGPPLNYFTEITNITRHYILLLLGTLPILQHAAPQFNSE